MSMERCTSCEEYFDTDYDVEGYVGDVPYHGHCRPSLYEAFSKAGVK